MKTTGISRRAFLKLSAAVTAGLTLRGIIQPGNALGGVDRAVSFANTLKQTASNAPGEKPNILLIIGDDLGADALHIDRATGRLTVQIKGTDAYPLPNLEKLWAKGIHFTQAWANPTCSPSRGTLYTGMQPWRTGVGDVAGNNVMPMKLPGEGTPEVRTIANCLSAAGYQTALIGKWHLGEDKARAPTARGWHRHDGILGGGLAGRDKVPPVVYTEAESLRRYYTWTKDFSDAHTGAWLTGIPAEERTYAYATADQVFSARDWIRQTLGVPWWLTLAVFAPHDPFNVPPEGTYTIRFKNPDKPTNPEMFVAMMEALDCYLGQFFADPSPELRNRLKNTVIVFWGDNGTLDELMPVKGTGKGTVYTGGVHVPLVIADGGALFGDKPCYLDANLLNTRQNHMVSAADLFQTMIDITGDTTIAPRYATDSISLTPYLKNIADDPRFKDWQERTYNFSQFFADPTTERFPLVGERATISDGRYKLNYQSGKYEFTELTFDEQPGIFKEQVTNNFQHPAAALLWQTLTTPGGRYYAEVNGQGKKFPPLAS